MWITRINSQSLGDTKIVAELDRTANKGMQNVTFPIIKHL